MKRVAIGPRHTKVETTMSNQAQGSLEAEVQQWVREAAEAGDYAKADNLLGWRHHGTVANSEHISATVQKDKTEKKAKLSMQDAESFVDRMKQRFARSPEQYDRFIEILQVRRAPPMQWRVGNLTRPMRANARVRPGISSAAAHLGEHEQEHGRATARPP